jgi:hypothetical protein
MREREERARGLRGVLGEYSEIVDSAAEVADCLEWFGGFRVGGGLQGGEAEEETKSSLAGVSMGRGCGYRLPRLDMTYIQDSTTTVRLQHLHGTTIWFSLFSLLSNYNHIYTQDIIG